MTRRCAVAADVVLGLAPYAVAADAAPRGVFVPCGPDRARMLNDTAVRRNSAVFGGGGLFSNAGTATLTGGGFVSHRAAETAGGIFNGGRVTAAGSPVTGNLPNDCAGSPAPVPGCAG